MFPLALVSRRIWTVFNVNKITQAIKNFLSSLNRALLHRFLFKSSHAGTDGTSITAQSVSISSHTVSFYQFLSLFVCSLSNSQWTLGCVYRAVEADPVASVKICSWLALLCIAVSKIRTGNKFKVNLCTWIKLTLPKQWLFEIKHVFSIFEFQNSAGDVGGKKNMTPVSAKKITPAVRQYRHKA